MRDPNAPCLFCTPRGMTRRNKLAWCTRDSFPVSPGHSLVIPFHHCESLFDLTAEEMAACLALLKEEWAALTEELKPDGCNVGINVGRAAGQSVLHVHIHLIPRYAGDHPRPQGGVRQIIPWKADYPRSSRPAEGLVRDEPGERRP